MHGVFRISEFPDPTTSESATAQLSTAAKFKPWLKLNDLYLSLGNNFGKSAHLQQIHRVRGTLVMFCLACLYNQPRASGSVMRMSTNGAYSFNTIPVSAPNRLSMTVHAQGCRFQALILGDQIMLSTNSDGSTVAEHESGTDFMPAEC